MKLFKGKDADAPEDTVAGAEASAEAQAAYESIDFASTKAAVTAGFNQFKLFEKLKDAIDVLEARQNYSGEIDQRIATLDRVYRKKEADIVATEEELEALHIEAKTTVANAEEAAAKIAADTQAKVDEINAKANEELAGIVADTATAKEFQRAVKSEVDELIAKRAELDQYLADARAKLGA